MHLRYIVNTWFLIEVIDNNDLVLPILVVIQLWYEFILFYESPRKADCLLDVIFFELLLLSEVNQ